MDQVIPALIKSTAPITRLAIHLGFLVPSTLDVIARALPALQFIDILDDADSDPFETISDNLDWLPPDEPRLVDDLGTRKYPRLTPVYVDTLFGALERIRGLRSFVYGYLYTKRTDRFTTTDLLQSLKWRDTAQYLKLIQINHVKLVRNDDGSWVQKKAIHWLV